MAGLDKIVLEGLEFHARHGVFEAETQFGARFIVDVELYLSLTGDDDLSQTVDYSAVYELVRTVVTETRFRLIEALAQRLADALLGAQELAEAVVVRVTNLTPRSPASSATCMQRCGANVRRVRGIL